MAMKKMSDIGSGNTLFRSWEDDVKDMMLARLDGGEIAQIRFIDAVQTVVVHWVPAISKKQKRMTHFPSVCLRWDCTKDAEDPELECPFCDLGVDSSESKVCVGIDVDALYAGKPAVRLFRAGRREQEMLDKFQQFNKVNGTPYSIGDPKYGRIIQMTYSKSPNPSSSNWAMTLGDRIRARISEDKIIVKIPSEAQSELAGQVVDFPLPQLDQIIYPPTLQNSKQKIKIMDVVEAVRRKQDSKKDKDQDEESPRSRRRDRDDDDDRDEDDEPRRSRSRRDEDDEDEKPARARRRKNEDEDEDEKPARSSRRKDDDEDDEDEKPKRRSAKEDEDEDEPPKRRRATRDEDEDEPPKRRRAPKADDDDEDLKPPQADDDDEDDEDEKPRRSSGDKGQAKKCSNNTKDGSACPKHKRCWAKFGEPDTEDCTQCVHRKRCVAETNSDDE